MTSILFCDSYFHVGCTYLFNDRVIHSEMENVIDHFLRSAAATQKEEGTRLNVLPLFTEIRKS